MREGSGDGALAAKVKNTDGQGWRIQAAALQMESR
jgi:hypothetical protein